MKFISIFNDVLGPVMRGPSSSHTAGSYHIGRLVRDLLGEEPSSARFTFDPDGSYARVFARQGADLAFAAGISGWQITDNRFDQALILAKKKNLSIEFKVSPLKITDHPNNVSIKIAAKNGKKLSAFAQSIGGGSVKFTRLNEWKVNFSGKNREIFFQCERDKEKIAEKILQKNGYLLEDIQRQKQKKQIFFSLKPKTGVKTDCFSELLTGAGITKIWTLSPLFFTKNGEAIFSSSEEMISLSQNRNCSLGEIGLEYESKLLGISEKDCLQQMLKRLTIMRTSIDEGMEDKNAQMLLLDPSAGKINKAEINNRLPIGGIHTKAAARAMAVMHGANSRKVVCAAPTGGSAGVIPGVITSFAEEKNLSTEQMAMGLFAAGAIGLIVANRATFAAEVAGCQVEIGAAGAMSAAAVADLAGGTIQQAVDSAAIFFQNSMGSVCDLVQGLCEIPCHTRNAVSASGAFVCSDLIFGGYQNRIPLDETIDAMFSVGKMLPAELLCTARGGLAVTPSALAMKIKK